MADIANIKCGCLGLSVRVRLLGVVNSNGNPDDDLS